MIQKEVLGNAWNLIDELADESTKERFELDDILYDISMKIFDYRSRKGITQKQLAEVLDIKQSMVSKLESGEYNPTIEQLWKISKKLKWNFSIKLEEYIESDENEDILINVWNTENKIYGSESEYLPELEAGA